MNKKDPYSCSNPVTSSSSDVDYRIALETYFDGSIGGSVDKIYNFTKYILRQVLTRFLARTDIFKQVIDVPGSIMECGVLAGAGLMTWAQLSAIYEPVNHPCRIIGFDVFPDEEMVVDIERCIDLYDKNRALNHIPKVSLVRGNICDTPRNISRIIPIRWCAL